MLSEINAIRSGDAAAFETLFQTHYTGLFVFASALVEAPDVAEEIVQDVFFALWQQRATLEVRSSLRAYLYGAVRNRALNYRRALSIERVHGARALAGSTADPPADPLLMLELNEAARLVRRAIERLPPRCREVIDLRWTHQLSHTEIADALGIGRKAVEIQITRGLRALRQALRESLE